MPVAVALVIAAVVAVAGGYYLFFSRAARRLAPMEGDDVNGRRHRLRRTNGAVLVALAGLFAAGSLLDPRRHPWAYVTVWFTIVFLLAVVMSLATIDVRLTARLRRGRNRS